MADVSVLDPPGSAAAGDAASELPDSFRDLNLDQLVDDMAQGREAASVRALFARPLLGADAIRYRQDVFRDLERAACAAAVHAFGAAMQTVRADLENARVFHHPRQRDWWRLEAVLAYCEGAEAFALALAAAETRSAALRALTGYAVAYVASDGFRTLAEEARAIARDLGAVVYSVRLRDARVTVLPYRGEADVTEIVARTFARFRRGPGRDYRVKAVESLEMNHVEGQILDRVAALFPDVFGRLEALAGGGSPPASFLDPVLVAFDRDVQFYLAYLAYIEPVRKVGLALCYPEMVATDEDSACRSAFDLVLAHNLALEGKAAVASDWQAAGGERGFIVTGPNHGGKTTFARTVGQLHVLAAIGCPVPGVSARLAAVDRVFTHFEREERAAESPQSKFEDDLVRVRAILAEATPRSLIVINEMLASTTLRDGEAIGRRVLELLAATGARYVWVTFIETLATLDGVVSLAAVTDEHLASTFQVLRRPPTGVAHALALARRYGLDEDAVRRRLGA